MIQNEKGEKVSAQVKAKLLLNEYLDSYSLQDMCNDFDSMKRTEPDKVQEQLNKLIARMKKAVVIKEK